MLINFSNHASSLWSNKQLNLAVERYGQVVDIPFPVVDPKGDSDYIRSLAEQYLAEIMKYPDIQAVHIMGEQTLCFVLISLLKEKGICCIASTCSRPASPDKELKFVFESFRPY